MKELSSPVSVGSDRQRDVAGSEQSLDGKSVVSV